MADDATWMFAISTDHLARLLAFRVAITRVAGFEAIVVATGQWFTTRATTGDALHVAWNVVADLMSPDTGLARELHTRRALLLAVAVMSDGMLASVSLIAGLMALRGRGTAGDWRVQNLSAAVTGQLFKTCMETRWAIAHMARLLTGVNTTLELASTLLEAQVIRIHTTQLSTFMPPTMLLLGALPVTDDL